MQTSAEVSEVRGAYVGSWAVATHTEVCCGGISSGKQELVRLRLTASAGQARFRYGFGEAGSKAVFTDCSTSLSPGNPRNVFSATFFPSTQMLSSPRPPG